MRKQKLQKGPECFCYAVQTCPGSLTSGPAPSWRLRGMCVCACVATTVDDRWARVPAWRIKNGVLIPRGGDRTRDVRAVRRASDHWARVLRVMETGLRLLLELLRAILNLNKVQFLNLSRWGRPAATVRCSVDGARRPASRARGQRPRPGRGGSPRGCWRRCSARGRRLQRRRRGAAGVQSGQRRARRRRSSGSS